MFYVGIPNIPIPLNNAYSSRRGGGRFLTPEGRKYKEETTSFIARNCLNELRFFEKNKPYAAAVHFVFADHSLVINKGYPEKTQNRYKRNDVGNRLKLFEDALSDATGIDDAHNWVWMLSKGVGSQDFTHLWMWSIEDEPNNIVSESASRLLATVPIK